MSASPSRNFAKFTAADWLSGEVLALAQRLGTPVPESHKLAEIVASLAEITTENRGTHLKIEEAETLEFLKKTAASSPTDSITGTPQTFLSGKITPLVLDAENAALYFFRHYKQEVRTAQILIERACADKVVPVSEISEKIIASELPFPLNAEQKAAVRSVVSRPMTIISGGPGTGKTTLLLRALICLFTENPEARVVLAAPTGKAAARMKESVQAQVREICSSEQALVAFPQDVLKKAESPEPATLHRVLGIGASPLASPGVSAIAADYVIADESSMIDQALMFRLLSSLRAGTRLVLLGDKNQLDSVGAGRVFGAICSEEKLACARVDLTESRRFDAAGVLGRMARAVVRGDVDGVASALDEPLSSERERAVFRFDSGEISPEKLDETLSEIFPEKLQNVPADAKPEEMLALLDSARVLTPLRRGKFGAEALNARARKLFAPTGSAVQEHFHGQPILVTRNAAQERLFNGDTGIILRDAAGTLIAHFRGDDGTIRRIPAALLPDHETAYAMSIHKAQGSEFARLGIVFPPEGSHTEFFSRQLLYTALTRFRESGENSLLRLLFDRDSLLGAVSRENPLRELLFAHT
ncbi:MAG: exodeoxyribonuclease V subunit alpha [Opitutales bacterium]|nr:exodeoxyribonuclease V subunit alpha [Opitutales bacterium]